MTEPIREQLKTTLKQFYNAEPFCGSNYYDNWADTILSVLGLSDLTDEQLAIIKKKLEQTRGKCPECKGLRTVRRLNIGEYDETMTSVGCPTCKMTGFGKVRPEKLAVISKGDLYFTKEQLSQEDWAAKYYKD